MTKNNFAFLTNKKKRNFDRKLESVGKKKDKERVYNKLQRKRVFLREKRLVCFSFLQPKTIFFFSKGGKYIYNYGVE